MDRHAHMTRDNAAGWLRYVDRRPSADLQLFCFPFAGGGASIFRKWGTKLPRSVEVCAIQLPGREDRLLEPPFQQVQPLVETLAEAVFIDREKPFAFFGHSMGALLAFELSRVLRRLEGRQPEHLFVSGRRAPHLPDRNPTTYDLPHAEFVQELRRLRGTPNEVLQDPDMMAVVMPMLRADFTLCETYSYVDDVPLTCSISAFGGSEDREVDYDEVAGWRQVTTGPFSLQMIPGGHFFLMGPGEAQLLTALSDELERLLGMRNAT
jgi:medium-chain acyl-[acyl-carrier-protein] hydrolase